MCRRAAGRELRVRLTLCKAYPLTLWHAYVVLDTLTDVIVRPVRRAGLKVRVKTGLYRRSMTTSCVPWLRYVVC